MDAMTREEAIREAFALMATHLPASWVERGDGEGATVITPKAAKLRDAIGEAILRSYLRGRQLSVEEYRDGKR